MRNTRSGIIDISDFLGFQLDEKQISHIQHRCSREHMTQMEERGSLVDREYNFVRRADKQRRTEIELTGELRSLIDRRCKFGIQAMGY
jgi:hypothetical protein